MNLNIPELSLVVLIGATGSGKSTTLCAMVDYMNRTRHDHIITIEDPVEFVHENIRSIVVQQEVLTDVLNTVPLPPLRQH